MTKDIDILGIGNAIMDIIAPVPDDFLSAQSIERGSMTLVDEPRALSLNGALQTAGELREIAGGSAIADISKAQIARAKTIYLEGYLFDSDDQKAAYVRAAEIAQATGGQVALTLSDSFCVARHRAGFRQLAEHQTDILFANEDELLALFETDRLDTALDALSGMRPVVCVTRGEKGSVIQTNTRRHLVPAAPITKIIDTTGAGDQYAAGVLAGRAMGMDWADAGYLGSIAAAEVIQHYGARPETPIHQIAAYATL